ncbi:MAG: hypothetical protein H6816_14220 [Phycisphaerales bacterium]|nr:hypothetical protein [Phycisphaerales bacterium]
MTTINVVGDCDASTCEGLELEGSFQIGKPDGSGDIALYTKGCNTEECACEVSDCCMSEGDGQPCDGESLTINANSGNFIFRDGETMTLKSGSLKDHDDLDCDLHALDDTIGTISESITFSVSLASSRSVTVGSGNCQIVVNYAFNVVN